MLTEVVMNSSKILRNNLIPLTVVTGIGAAALVAYIRLKDGGVPPTAVDPGITGGTGGGAGNEDLQKDNNSLIPTPTEPSKQNEEIIWDCEPIGHPGWPNAFRAALAASDPIIVEPGPYKLIHKMGDKELLFKLPELVHNGDILCVKINAPQSLHPNRLKEGRVNKIRQKTSGEIYRSKRG